MEKFKNTGLVFCLFVVLVVIFSSYFRASAAGAVAGALAGTPVLVHVFNRVVPRISIDQRLQAESEPRERDARLRRDG
jgi:hypothetical protein